MCISMVRKALGRMGTNEKLNPDTCYWEEQERGYDNNVGSLWIWKTFQVHLLSILTEKTGVFDNLNIKTILEEIP